MVNEYPPVILVYSSFVVLNYNYSSSQLITTLIHSLYHTLLIGIKVVVSQTTYTVFEGLGVRLMSSHSRSLNADVQVEEEGGTGH